MVHKVEHGNEHLFTLFTSLSRMKELGVMLPARQIETPLSYVRLNLSGLLYLVTYTHHTVP